MSPATATPFGAQQPTGRAAPKPRVANAAKRNS